MDTFLENVERLKEAFEFLEDASQFAALETMERALNWMTYRYEENNLEKEDEVQFSTKCLVENAEQMILDRYANEWQEVEPQLETVDKWASEASTSGTLTEEPESTNSYSSSGLFTYSIESDEMQSDRSHYISSNYENTNETLIDDQVEQLLYCFTCGLGKKNRKALYRHGVSSGHKTIDPVKKKKEKVEFITPCSSVSGVNLDADNGIAFNFEDMCGDLIEEKATEQPVLTFSELSKVETCHTCGTKFSNRKGLYRHGIRTGHKTRVGRAESSRGGSIGCELCSYSTTTMSYLKRHLKRSHGVES